MAISKNGMCLLTLSFLNVLLFLFPAGQVLKTYDFSTFFLSKIKFVWVCVN